MIKLKKIIIITKKIVAKIIMVKFDIKAKGGSQGRRKKRGKEQKKEWLDLI